VGRRRHHRVPLKEGGLGTQQADAAAASIAAQLGAAVEPQPFTAVLRGLLLTGVASAYLRSGNGEPEVAFNPLWSPTAKVAGRYIAPYLARQAGVAAGPVLSERAPHSKPEALADRDEIRRLATRPCARAG
jgi:sulfide:quinone oxidoreductase